MRVQVVLHAPRMYPPLPLCATGLFFRGVARCRTPRKNSPVAHTLLSSTQTGGATAGSAQLPSLAPCACPTRSRHRHPSRRSDRRCFSAVILAILHAGPAGACPTLAPWALRAPCDSRFRCFARDRVSSSSYDRSIVATCLPDMLIGSSVPRACTGTTAPARAGEGPLLPIPYWRVLPAVRKELLVGGAACLLGELRACWGAPD